LLGDSLNYETTFDLRLSETNVPQPLLELDLVGCVQGEFSGVGTRRTISCSSSFRLQP
jgi:hypothetical protein